MATYYSYKSTTSLPVTITWKCSNCKHINSKDVILTGEGSNFAMGKNTTDKAKVASDQSNFWFDSKFSLLTTRRGDLKSFRNLGFDFPCDNCRYREVWAGEKITTHAGFVVGAMAAAFIILCICSCCCVVGLIYGELPVWPLLISIGLLALLFYKSSDIEHNAEIKDIEKSKTNDSLLYSKPISSFPILVIDGKPLADLNIDIPYSVYHNINTQNKTSYDNKNINHSTEVITGVDSEKKIFKGNEPEEARMLLIPFIEELNFSFPDKRIIWDKWNHERWDKIAGYLRDSLGYANGKSFLEAYGYTIIANTDSAFFCSHCGKKIDYGSKYCCYCGHKL